ncbi:MAG: ATP-independent RNA helicase DbpA [Bacteroidia bacterium]
MTELSFSNLPLSPGQLANLESLDYREMTPIQAAALPPALAGTDLIGQAKTGSGKTVVFGLSLLSRLNPRDFGTQALVLCPTRELASQVATEIRRLARHQKNIKVVTLCGGQSIGPQIGSLEHGAHVVVGTPGRIKDHLRKETLSLERVSTLVLDEADRMLDMGFIDDIDTIVATTSKDRQTMFFSATFPDNIQALSSRFQRSPQRVSIAGQEANENITQRFYVCRQGAQLEGLEKLLFHYQPASAVVFCNTKKRVREVCDQLQQAGIQARALHGDMEQRDRDQVLILFKHQSCTVLVATDVAARGLDIDDLPAVVNVELPRDPEVYVHRIGRTGRAGKDGIALSLVPDSEMYRLKAIGDYQRKEIEFEPIEFLPNTGKPLPPPPFATLLIQAGRKDKVRAGDILGALTGDSGIAGKSVGKISITEYASYVGIARKEAQKALQGLQNGKIKGRKFKVREL